MAGPIRQEHAEGMMLPEAVPMSDRHRWFTLSGYPLSTMALFGYLVFLPTAIVLKPLSASFGLCILWPLIAIETLWRGGLGRIRIGMTEGFLLLALGGHVAAIFLNMPYLVVYDALERFFMLIQVFFIFLFLRCALEDEEPIAGGTRGSAFKQNLVTVILLATALQVFIGLVQAMLQNPYRVSGHIGNPNFFASMAASVFCFLLPFSRPKASHPFGRTGRILFTVFLILLPLLVIASRSRGAAVALLLATALYLGLEKGTRKSLVCLFALILLFITIPNPLTNRMVQMNPPVDQFERSFIWHVDLALIRDHPLGLGPNMAKYHFPAMAHTLAPLSETAFKSTRDPAHNLFIEAGLEGGLIALLALLLLTLYIFYHAWRRRKHAGDAPVSLGAGLGLLVLLLHSQVDCLDRSHILTVLGAIMLALFLEEFPLKSIHPFRWRDMGGRFAARILASTLILPAALVPMSWPLSEGLRDAVHVREGGGPLTPKDANRLAWAQKICPCNYYVSEDRFTAAWDVMKTQGMMNAYQHAYNTILLASIHNPLSAKLHRKFARFLGSLPPDIAQSIPHLRVVVRMLHQKADALNPLDVVGCFHGLEKVYLPDNPRVFLQKSKVFDDLLVPFALLEYKRGFILERMGNRGPALHAYRKALRAYRSSLRLSRTLPDGTLIKAFHVRNVTRFRLSSVQDRIHALEPRPASSKE